jgi:hypothetical protein
MTNDESGAPLLDRAPNPENSRLNCNSQYNNSANLAFRKSLISEEAVFISWQALFLQPG